jgi:NADH:ubiquinone oxidoreductase subunit H
MMLYSSSDMDNGLKETDAAAVIVGSAAAVETAVIVGSATAVIVGSGTAVSSGRATNGSVGRRGFTQYTADELELISQDVITCQRAEGKWIYQKDLVSVLSVVVMKTSSLDPSHVLQRVLQQRGRLMI